MLTFSREQRCIEAAVVVASPPPSPLCIPLPRALCLPFLFSSVQTDGDEKLAADQNTPPTITACHPPHMLSPPFLSLTLPFLPLVIFSFLPLFSPAPLILLLHSPAVLAPPVSLSLSVHPSPPVSSIFHFSVILDSSLLTPSSFSLSLSSPLFSSPCLSSPKLPRRSSRNRV